MVSSVKTNYLNMKKTTFFVDLQGYLGDYVKKIYTQAVTNDNEIVSLQKKLNVTISTMSKMPATAENCKTLWNRLTDLVRNAGVVHTEYEAYQEIINAVDDIGYSIAYVCPRVGVKKPIESIVRREKHISMVENGTIDFRGNKLVYTGNELLKQFMRMYLWRISNNREEYEEENLYLPLEEFYKVAVEYQKGVLNHFKEDISEKYNSKVIDEEEIAKESSVKEFANFKLKNNNL